jgi:hypothetical protein
MIHMSTNPGEEDLIAKWQKENDKQTCVELNVKDKQTGEIGTLRALVDFPANAYTCKELRQQLVDEKVSEAYTDLKGLIYNNVSCGDTSTSVQWWPECVQQAESKASKGKFSIKEESPSTFDSTLNVESKVESRNLPFKIEYTPNATATASRRLSGGGGLWASAPCKIS